MNNRARDDMLSSRLIPKTLGIASGILPELEQIALVWNKEKSQFEKTKTWADVARHGMRLAIEEHRAKARKAQTTRAKQLSIRPATKKPAKKKASKKKPPPRPKSKPKKKSTRARGRK